MADQPTHSADIQGVSEKDSLARRLESISWALFLVWIGAAILIDVGWGWGLVGVAAIILGEAAIRWFNELPIGGFWVAMGVILLAGGVWELFQVSWPLVPILLIACGLMVLWGAFTGKSLKQ
jgi:hypothetical protein